MDDAAQNQGLTPEEKPIVSNDTGLNTNQKPTTSQIQKLDDKIKSVSLPQELQEKVVAMVDRLRLIGNDSSFFIELDSTSRYIDWVTNLPWEKKSEDILNLTHAKEVLDKNHFGLTDVKNNILEYISLRFFAQP